MIKKYTKKNGETAYKFVAYLGVDPVTGKQVRTTRQGFKTEREAKRAEVELINDYERNGGWKKSVNMTFDDVAKLWFEHYEKTVKPSTYLVTENNYKFKIQPVFGFKNIKSITVLMCQKLMNDLSSHSVYGNLYSIVNRVFKFAVHLDIIDSNPIDKILKPKGTHVPKSEVFENFYTKDELTHFLKIVEKEKDISDLVFYRILGYGGLRVGEALALNNTDFNFKEGYIDINKTIAKTKKGFITQTPKTKKSKRKVYMDDLTMKLAKEYIHSMIKPLHNSFRIFDVTPTATRQKLNRFIKAHNLKPITPHGFRHTHASLLYEANVPIKVAQERLGHAKISITLDLYTHLSKTQKDSETEKLFSYIA